MSRQYVNARRVGASDQRLQILPSNRNTYYDIVQSYGDLEAW